MKCANSREKCVTVQLKETVCVSLMSGNVGASKCKEVTDRTNGKQETGELIFKLRSERAKLVCEPSQEMCGQIKRRTCRYVKTCVAKS